MIAPAIPLPVTIPASSASRHQNQLGCQATCKPKHQAPAWHARFLRLLPDIREHASFCFRRLPHDAREEAIAETVANALAAYARLVELGKEDLAYPTPLVRFAVARVREGRSFTSGCNLRDLLSTACRRRNRITVEQLDHFNERIGSWDQLVVEDRRSGPADVAATRVDFRTWLATLSRRDRRVAEVLAVGESTKSAARLFRLSEGRISQLRRELYEAWQRFQGELDDGAALAVA